MFFIDFYNLLSMHSLICAENRKEEESVKIRFKVVILKSLSFDGIQLATNQSVVIPYAFSFQPHLLYSATAPDIALYFCMCTVDQFR